MKYKIISVVALTFFFCWNGSMVDSEGKSKNPEVNFNGIIEDHTKTFKAKNILFGGKYKAIPAYQVVKPKSKTIEKEAIKENVDPKENKSLLDLSEIKSIELKYPEHPTESTVKINGRDFTEIVITSINGTKKNYLVESSRKITCQEVDKGPNKNKPGIIIDRELNITHIKKLEIKGYKSIQENDTREEAEQRKEVKKTTAETEKILDKIEENVKNLSAESPITLEKMKAIIITLLKSLRDQLQKILNML